MENNSEYDKDSRSSSESEDTEIGSIDRALFEVPEGLEFPLELNKHLKDKLHSVLEQNWHLRRHLDYLDKEVIDLRKYRSEHRERCGREPETDPSSASTTIMSQRIVELSKKNRDMTAQVEVMKNRVQKLVRENDSLRNMVECFRDKDTQEEMMSKTFYSQLEMEQPAGAATTNTTPGTQQHVQLTNKVIEYRRQNQLLRMELKTALRALCQEVGDGATPHNVLNTVTGNGVPSWRGRQQQIISLQQKLTDLQLKYKEAMSNNNLISSQAFEEISISAFQQTNGGGDADTFASPNLSPTLTATNIPQRGPLIQQDRKKQEQIEKLTQELDSTTKEWKAAQQELKACKARIGTLESNMKTYKSHVEILEGKLTDGEKEDDAHIKEMKQIRFELASQKERDRKYRDQVAAEIQEGQKTLQKERSIITRLQSVIEEKQSSIENLESEIIDLRHKLDVCCSGKFGGGIETIDRIRQLENQLEKAAKAMEAGERERQSLLKMMQEYLSQAEAERKKTIQASEHTARLTNVLRRANQCINECLEVGQVTSKDILQEVEHIRSLIRELNMGDLYCYENVQHSDLATKLRTQIGMLKSEVASLKGSLKELSAARRKDLENFVNVSDRVKSDWAEVATMKQKTFPF